MMDLLIEFLAHYGQKKEAILSITAGVSMLAAISLLLVYMRTLKEQYWLLSFGLFYAILAVQYVVRWIFVFTNGSEGLHHPGVGVDVVSICGVTEEQTRTVFSTINNVCLFLTALILLRWLKRFEWLHRGFHQIPNTSRGM